VPFIFKFEELRRYPFRVAVAPGHPFGQLKAVPLGKLAAEPMVSFNRRDYSEHFRILDEIFSPGKLKPRVKVEVDGASSLITEVEACAALPWLASFFSACKANG
jgi:DNA-binding transcriptional LysR family regulator